jgi:hypothetical protein
MSPTNSKLIIGCLIGVVMSALAYFFLFNSNKDNAKTALDSALSAAVAGAGSVTERASASAARRTPSNTQNISSAQVALKQVTFSKSELEANPKFWMLAYSEQDIGWLTRFGYPTLEEESKLSQATTEQLNALAEAGNLNAKVHLGIRLAQPALMSNDTKSLRQAAYMIEQSLTEGGPYQAAKTAEFFVNLAKNRRSLGELSDDQRAALQNELLPLYERAKGISAMFGDFAAARAVNEYRDVGIMFGLPASQPMQFEFAMARVANLNNARARRGLAPYELITRPSPPYSSSEILSFQGTNTVFVR